MLEIRWGSSTPWGCARAGRQGKKALRSGRQAGTGMQAGGSEGGRPRCMHASSACHHASSATVRQLSTHHAWAAHVEGQPDVVLVARQLAALRGKETREEENENAAGCRPGGPWAEEQVTPCQTPTWQPKGWACTPGLHPSGVLNPRPRAYIFFRSYQAVVAHLVAVVCRRVEEARLAGGQQREPQHAETAAAGCSLTTSGSASAAVQRCRALAFHGPVFGKETCDTDSPKAPKGLARLT